MPRLIIAAGGGPVTVVVPAEVLAFADLGQQGYLAAYVSANGPLAMDDHVPFWFLAIVIWACQIKISLVSDTFGDAVPHVKVNHARPDADRARRERHCGAAAVRHCGWVL